jgi:hypothetical protein
VQGNKYDVITGCVKYSPGSNQGNRFWYELQEYDLATFQPDLKASPWKADNFYFFYDLTVVGDIIYECQSSNYC